MQATVVAVQLSPLPAGAAMAQEFVSKGFSGTQSIRWNSNTENKSLSGIHIFSAKQDTGPVANKLGSIFAASETDQ